MTGLNSNIDQVIEKFRGIAASHNQVDFSEALIVGVNAARAKLHVRVFGEGLDNTNTPFGIYIGQKKLPGSNPVFTPYEYKRVQKGRQVAYKDLEFQGALRRGQIVIKKSNTLVVCAIVNEKLILIAKGQEEQVSRIRKTVVKIWTLSPDEKKFLKSNTSAALKQIYVRLLNT